MRPAVVFPTFAAILLIVALAVPLPYGPSDPPLAPLPLWSALPRCLALAYDRRDGWDLPKRLRLYGGRAPLAPSLLRAVGERPGEVDGLWKYAAWRPAGGDSIDIGWHHSPILRLPIGGDTLRGRAAPHGVASLFQTAFERDVAVRAVRVPCADVPAASH